VTLYPSLDYLAGFFDAEGCITASKGSSIEISVSNTFKPILYEFKDRFGGDVFSNGKRKNRRHREAFKWRIYNREDCKRVMEELIPHLHEKLPQALVALRLLDTPVDNPQERIKLRETLKRLKKLEYPITSSTSIN
jgi:hypothetical protein